MTRKQKESYMRIFGLIVLLVSVLAVNAIAVTSASQASYRA